MGLIDKLLHREQEEKKEVVETPVEVVETPPEWHEEPVDVAVEPPVEEKPDEKESVPSFL